MVRLARGQGGRRPSSQPIRIVTVDICILEHLTNRTVTDLLHQKVHSKDLSGLPGSITNKDRFHGTGAGRTKDRSYLSNPNLNRKSHREIEIEVAT